MALWLTANVCGDSIEAAEVVTSGLGLDFFDILHSAMLLEGQENLKPRVLWNLQNLASLGCLPQTVEEEIKVFEMLRYALSLDGKEGGEELL